MLMRNFFGKSLHLQRFGFFRSMHNMSITLYGDEASPPVRFVMMTASLLEVNYQFHKIDLFAGENKTEHFTKLNPLQKVPILAVGEKIICDSHAIALYLCRLKGAQDLYPEDPMERAKIDQMMFFNSGSLFPLDSSIFTDYFSGKWSMDENRVDQWNLLMDYLDLQLSQYTWLAGDKVTLCDICCGTTISSLELLVPLVKHERVRDWLMRLNKLQCFEINRRGVNRLKCFVDKINNSKVETVDNA